MPTRTPHLCPTCHATHTGPCPQHKAWATSTRHGSTRAGRKLRTAVLAANPLCAQPGCQALATQDDHIIPMSLRPDLDLDPDNHQGLCEPHHREKTQQESRHAIRRASPHND